MAWARLYLKQRARTKYFFLRVSRSRVSKTIHNGHDWPWLREIETLTFISSAVTWSLRSFDTLSQYIALCLVSPQKWQMTTSFLVSFWPISLAGNSNRGLKLTYILILELLNRKCRHKTEFLLHIFTRRPLWTESCNIICTQNSPNVMMSA